MCDKAQEGDPSYQAAKSYSKPECLEANSELQRCLDSTGKDWRKCQVQVAKLSKCMRGNS